ncbi:hypothetical protein EVAR_25260_1 [Eumeta japonica]|uniref:Uncharacterized protein n=1 Tax=Eumeta variegata TaxID=151549 RepID=A0A4C1VMS1_EUMVA|nr:hypothetical protein EVAR_25260_1 [Eumeta japonica]
MIQVEGTCLQLSWELANKSKYIDKVHHYRLHPSQRRTCILTPAARPARSSHAAASTLSVVKRPYRPPCALSAAQIMHLSVDTTKFIATHHN